MTALAHFIRTYDDALMADFCQQTVEYFEQHPELQQRNGASIRSGLAESSWTEMDLSDCDAFGFRNIITNCIRFYKSRYEQDCQIQPALPEPSDLAPLILKRYDPGQDQFQPHYDSVGPVSSRYLVFLWYLNGVEEGGETAFIDLDIAVRPAAGRMLMFPPYWMYRHTGKQPTSGPKYILSTYALW